MIRDLVGSILLLVSATVSAESCEATVADVVAQWGARHQTAITQPVAEVVGKDFCSATQEFHQQSGGSTSEQTAAMLASQVISDYFHSLDIGEAESVGVLLGQALGFGAGAGGRPEFPRWGKIRMHYIQDIDQLLVNKQEFQRVKSVWVKPGLTEVVGKIRGKTICEHQGLKIDVAPPVKEVSC